MQQQCLCEAMTTEAMMRDFDCPPFDCAAEDHKMTIRDVIHVAEQVALTLGVCGVVHLVG